jgi:hypothetical protein
MTFRLGPDDSDPFVVFSPDPAQDHKGEYLTRLAPIASACVFLFLATFSHAQQIDVTVGGSTALAAKNNTSSEASQPPAEKGGVYPSISADVVFKSRFGFRRVGLMAETSWRDHKGSYNGYEQFRPIFTDVNALYQPQLSKKMGFDFTAGIGVASDRFYIAGLTCGSAPGTCYTSKDHFMEQLGAGFRYYVWHRLPNVFVRPEIHYYHIQNNFEFHSDNLFRAGASVGYTFGPH